MPIKSLILGAGQEVGKSCVVVSMGGKSIMFDCGMHMGYSDHRRYPDFSLISKTGNFTQAIDCLIITHFHLDHIGALPYFTEVCGYEGPIYMTYPTKALAPLMLEDYRKIMVERRGEQEQFSVLQIHECLKKVTAVDLRQTVNVDLDLKLRAYYAGHVLGAAMFYVEVGESNVVYTGDYNTTADRHLGAAQIDRLQPDLLITESTYATTVRDSKHFREREFLKTVHDCILKGGKVLIPVFALGRAQELCILLDEYWERMNLEVPIYFSAGLTMQANVYYKLLIGWTNQKVKDSYVTRNTFDFKHVSSFERSQIDVPGPCVLFATPGMLSGGLSLEVFKHWAPVEKNMVVVPGYCVAGTVGHKLMSGKPTKINLDRRTQLDVRCQIYHLSFSAHTDAKGIMDLVKHVAPRHVILVHGEKPKMALLKNRIATELRIQCFDPANNETVEVPSEFFVKVKATTQYLASASNPTECKEDPISERLSQMRASEAVERSWRISTPTRESLNFEGFVVIDDSREIKVIHPTEVSTELGVKQHKLSFSCYCPINLDFMDIESIQFQDSQQIVISYKEHNITPLVGAQEILPVESGKVEPSKKKYRMDLQRTLSLDLEREPVADDIDDALCGYPIDAVNATTISPGSSFKQWKENKKESENRIDLNINVVPELTGFNCAETAGKKVLCLGFSDVLRAVHLGLLESLGCSSLKVEDDCLICNSFRACICSDSMLNGHYIQTKHAVILACSWSYEDEKLANRTMNLMRNMKFKLE